MNNKLIIAGILGTIGVGLGAFGAHGLKPLLDLQELTNYKTAVNYQMVHVVILVGLALYPTKNKQLNIAFWAMTLGIILFSGSLYLLSTKSVLGLTSWKWLGPITPLGGLSFIVGWLSIAFSGFRQNIVRS